MPRRSAGARYPHATTYARTHDHRFCPVVAVIAAQAKAGAEPWGTLHALDPVPAEAIAAEAVKGLYRARRHGYSIRARYALNGDGVYVITVQVWTREMGKQNVISRATAGERLPYNVMRGPDALLPELRRGSLACARGGRGRDHFIG